MCNADLRGADLRRAILQGTRLDGTNTCVIYGLRWEVYKYPTDMQIGCERHSYEDWNNFTGSEIDAMDEEAMDFWRKNKQFLLSPHNNEA